MPELDNILAKSPKPVVVDVETTGFGAFDRVVEIAIVTLDPETWETQDEFDTLVNPERDVGPTGVHGVTAGMVELAPVFEELLPPVAQRLRGTVLVAHNLPFDTRMLRYEFERHGVPIDFGHGWCTLSATGTKLGVACEREGIRLTNAHRALADARATAELARRLRIAERRRDTRPVQVDALNPTANARTHRRGLADAGTSPMHRMVCRSTYPHGDEAMAQYLDALDWVLDDGVIDRTEWAAMNDLAREWGLSSKRQREAHHAYLECMIGAAERDGFFSKAEHDILRRIADQLQVDARIPERTPARRADLAPGMRICFTGEAVVEGRMWKRADLWEIARANGCEPVSSVTKKTCDMLVAADVSSASGMVRKARAYGKPIISVARFLDQCRSGDSSLPHS
ncbi:MAG: exonuclease domain-containing protein [Gemmatimonadetes bacterium]|nr:exonuclease domain-containing protein [Gemmatimonadota bacterium]